VGKGRIVLGTGRVDRREADLARVHDPDNEGQQLVHALAVRDRLVLATEDKQVVEHHRLDALSVEKLLVGVPVKQALVLSVRRAK